MSRVDHWVQDRAEDGFGQSRLRSSGYDLQYQVLIRSRIRYFNTFWTICIWFEASDQKLLCFIELSNHWL